ncbi:MAG: polysaccharide deacetylase family protein [Bacillus sp. (in: firmicutes)]
MTARVKAIVAGIVVVFVFGFVFIQKNDAAGEQYVQITKTAGLFDVIDGKEIRVGNANAKQTFVLHSSDEKYYYIKFGNNIVYFDNRNGKTVSRMSAFIKRSDKGALKKVVITKERASIYDSTGWKKKLLATVTINMRYPVLEKVKGWYKVDIGKRVGYIPANAVTEDPGVPVLMYHHMLPNPERTPFAANPMVVRVSAFKEQMDYLKKDGWRTITLAELERYIEGKQNLTGRAVVITFDDGNMSTIHHAYPILKRNKQKAAQFVIGGRVKDQAKPYDEMTYQYVGHKEMKTSTDVYDYQLHSFSMHLRDGVTYEPYLVKKGYDDVLKDTTKGIEHVSLFDQQPERIKYYAYPFGQYDQEAIEAISAAGITMAFTTAKGNVQIGDDPYTLKRQGVSPKHTMKDFVDKLYGTYKGR